MLPCTSHCALRYDAVMSIHCAWLKQQAIISKPSHHLAPGKPVKRDMQMQDWQVP